VLLSGSSPLEALSEVAAAQPKTPPRPRTSDDQLLPPPKRYRLSTSLDFASVVGSHAPSPLSAASSAAEGGVFQGRGSDSFMWSSDVSQYTQTVSHDLLMSVEKHTMVAE